MAGWNDCQFINGKNMVSKGVLYVVATPIGNLDDITYRAVKLLREVDLIAAEDTRHSHRLLQHYSIVTPMTSLHEHNEQARIPGLLERLSTGDSIALLSDAGTPLISDPGFPLVREARRTGIDVVPLPGPNAAVCALSAAGLPSDRFLFAGFPPKQGAQRRRWLEALAREQATLVFYESSHRILESLKQMAEVFGPDRSGVIARELTKLHETFLHGKLSELVALLEEDDNQRRGEFVLLLHGHAGDREEELSLDADRILEVLGAELPVGQAAKLSAQLTGMKKNELYQRLLEKRSD
jgi:16S rRNA (cytidine1402-2'-O)-methyltransferase